VKKFTVFEFEILFCHMSSSYQVVYCLS